MSTALPPDGPSNLRAHYAALAGCGSDERREHLRRMLRVPVWLEHPYRDNAVQLIDIGRAGVAFACAQPLDLGSTIALHFQLPTTAYDQAVSGAVVYCKLMPHSGLHKVGVRLHHVSDDIVECIVDFVTAPSIP